jgi:multicomponent Na+:H+ antiporter subunit C
MNLVFASVIGVLFGAGVFLVLKPDLFRVVVGVLLISNAANLTIMASGLTRGQPPIRPFEEGEDVSDPLVHAMTLTAIVIGFAVTAVLLALAWRVYRTHESVDLDELSQAEARAEAEQEAEREEIET